MMVAAEFRKEVTSTVLWLMNYKLRIQCFIVTPYKMGEKLFLEIDQILPMKTAEEYTISMAEKTQEEISNQEELKGRHVIRLEFWSKLLKASNEKFTLFQNISPSKYHWIGAGSGIRGAAYNYLVSKNFARCEIYLDRGDFDENKLVFDYLFERKAKIEEAFGGALEWERLDDKRASRIKYENQNFSLYNKEQWDDMVVFLVDGMMRMENAFKNPLKEVQRRLRSAN